MSDERDEAGGHSLAPAGFVQCLPTDAAQVWERLKRETAPSGGESMRAPTAGSSPPPAQWHEECEAALSEARAEAARILAEARAQAEALLKQADESRQQGRQAASEAQRAFDEALGLLLEQFDEQLRQRFETLERELPDIAIVAAEKILGQQIERDDHAVVGVIRSALRQVSGAGSVEVLVSPADEPVVREAQERLLREHGAGRLEVIASEQVDRGGAIVRSEQGEVDARIRVQLAALDEVLRESEEARG